MFITKQMDGSCGDAAMALGLSPLATLALRVSLMILTRITFGTEDRCLKVVIGSSNASIRVSRLRRSSSSQKRATSCTDVPPSGYTATTGEATSLPLPVASSSVGTTASSSPIDSAATLGAIY